MDNRNNQEFEIDLIHIIEVLWSKIIIIVICALLCATCAFMYAKLRITPVYESSAMLYVNSSSIKFGATSISLSDINTSKGLVETFAVLLKTRTTLERVIDETGVKYSYGTLNGMVSASAVNSTEVMRVTVKSSDPEEAALIANSIVKILPDVISTVISGTSVEVVDYAVVPKAPISPDITRNTLIGFLLGMVAACAVIIVLDLLDDTIRDDEYIMQRYDLPMLGVIPDFNTALKGGYYKSYGDNANIKQ